MLWVTMICAFCPADLAAQTTAREGVQKTHDREISCTLPTLAAKHTSAWRFASWPLCTASCAFSSSMALLLRRMRIS